MYLAYELTSLFTKVFLANRFYLYGSPKYSPAKYFPCTVSYSNFTLSLYYIAHNFEKVTIPYLIQMLLTQDGILRSTAAVQMRWAEKTFATLELFYDMWEHCEAPHHAMQPLAV